MEGGEGENKNPVPVESDLATDDDDIFQLFNDPESESVGLVDFREYVAHLLQSESCVDSDALLRMPSSYRSQEEASSELLFDTMLNYFDQVSSGAHIPAPCVHCSCCCCRQQMHRVTSGVACCAATHVEASNVCMLARFGLESHGHTLMLCCLYCSETTTRPCLGRLNVFTVLVRRT